MKTIIRPPALGEQQPSRSAIAVEIAVPVALKGRCPRGHADMELRSSIADVMLNSHSETGSKNLCASVDHGIGNLVYRERWTPRSSCILSDSSSRSPFITTTRAHPSNPRSCTHTDAAKVTSATLTPSGSPCTTLRTSALSTASSAAAVAASTTNTSADGPGPPAGSGGSAYSTLECVGKSSAGSASGARWRGNGLAPAPQKGQDHRAEPWCTREKGLSAAPQDGVAQRRGA
uniref:Uncharacterized protein n=1 Tax=Arundo donax TaxID=35708 RepID=A0A0A9DM50_ARUDO